ncbi:MAG: ComEC/Rec2 family competence protein [Spirochaetia bacterium]|nr:ComEC/Rec2 family competence protein [Spirochaetia bacterium]
MRKEGFYWHTDALLILAAILAAGHEAVILFAPTETAAVLLLIDSAMLIAISVIHEGRTLRVYLLLAIVLLASAVLNRAETSSFLYMEDSSIETAAFDEVAGVLRADSQFFSGEMQIAEIRITHLYSTSYEIDQSVDCRITAIFYSDSRWFQGERILMQGIFGENSEKPLFFGSKIFLIPSQSSIVNLYGSFRKKAIEYVYDRFSDLSPSAAELSAALVIGRKENRANPIMKLFREAGAAHLLALSGMHLQFIGGMLTWFFGKFMRVYPAKFSVTGFLLLFVGIAGANPSLLRALLLHVVLSFYRNPYDPLKMLRSLIGVFLLQAAILPPSTESAGFFLSYAALFGIGVLYQRLEGLFPGCLPKIIRAGAAASIAASGGAAFLLIGFFGEIYLMGPVSSIIVTFPVILFMGLSMLYLVPLPHWLMLSIGSLLELIYQFIEKIVFTISMGPVMLIPADRRVAASIGALVLTFLLLTVFLAIEYAVQSKGEGCKKNE